MRIKFWEIIFINLERYFDVSLLRMIYLLNRWIKENKLDPLVYQPSRTLVFTHSSECHNGLSPIVEDKQDWNFPRSYIPVRFQNFLPSVLPIFLPLFFLSLMRTLSRVTSPSAKRDAPLFRSGDLLREDRPSENVDPYFLVIIFIFASPLEQSPISMIDHSKRNNAKLRNMSSYKLC